MVLSWQPITGGGGGGDGGGDGGSGTQVHECRLQYTSLLEAHPQHGPPHAHVTHHSPVYSQLPSRASHARSHSRQLWDPPVLTLPRPCPHPVLHE